MPLHAFVDESKRRGLLVVAAVLASTDVTATRDAVRRLHLPRQRRIHFTKESSGRRRYLLEAVVALPFEVWLYECPSERRELDAREACLTRIVEDMAARDGERIVLELDDSTIQHDKRTLYEAVTKAGARNQLRYHHLRAVQENLLALPDMVAWSWAEGGQWRRTIRPLVTEHISL